MIKMLNKKAQLGHAVTWLWKFMIIVLVVGGIVFAVLNHYSQPIDVRDAEAASLARAIVECVAPNSIVKEFSNASIKACIPLDENEVYVNASLASDHADIGDPLLGTLCGAMEQNVGVTKYPGCHRSSYMLLDGTDLKELKLFIAIRKIEKNI
jgi:hypothetical protein